MLNEVRNANQFSNKFTSAPINKTAATRPEPIEKVSLSGSPQSEAPQEGAGGLMKAGALGLAALALGGCTTMATTYHPNGAVTTSQQFDPVGTAAAAVGAAILLDAMTPDVYYDYGPTYYNYGHHHHGHWGHGHGNYGGWNCCW